MNKQLSSNELRVLKALICGPVRASNLMDRFPDSIAVFNSMIARRLIAFDGSFYRITIEGRAAMPVDKLSKDKPETVSINHAKPIVDAVGKHPKAEVNPAAPTAIIYKPNALRVLELLESNPNCTAGFLAFEGNKKPIQLIKKYINKGSVLVIGETGMGKRPKYRLADGLTADAVYYGLETSAAPVSLEELRKPQQFKAFIEEKIQELDYKDDEPVISYDSHKRLSIDEVLLTQRQTTELLAFVIELGLVN